MPITTRVDLEEHFQDGDIPTQNDFTNLFDSYVHQSEDGITIYHAPDSTIRFGIGINTPGSSLGIKGIGDDQSLISFHKPDNSSTWSISQNIHFAGDSTATPPIPSSDNGGLNFQEQLSSGKISRLFIKEQTGYIGIGTTEPKRILDIKDNVADGFIGFKIQNTAGSVMHSGWAAGQVNNNTVTTKNGAFSFFEEAALSSNPPTERMTILAGGNVGINELFPETKFHVSVAASSASLPVALLRNSGIAQFGLVTKNLVFDDKGIQSRKGAYDTSSPPVLTLSTDALHLQNLGGDILIHANTSIADAQKVVIKDNIDQSTITPPFEDGKSGLGVGIGVVAPKDKLHVNGRIIIGDGTNAAVAGAIRFKTTGSVFEGHNGTAWVPFGGDNTVWENTTNENIRFIPEDAFVGIGMVSPVEPTSKLQVIDSHDIDTSATTTAVKFSATNNNTSVTPGGNDNRVGLEVSTSGVWSTSTTAKNIGLYVSQVTGQTPVNSNIAALLNGNVVIGALQGTDGLIGTAGTNVLAIQEGAAPTTKVGPSGSTNKGIQIYSLASGNPAVSIFNLRNGDGNIVRLFKGVAITNAANPVSNSSPTYGVTEANVINNLRLRILDLENRLIALGLLAAPSTSSSAVSSSSSISSE